MKTTGKYFRTDDRDVLEETYEAVIKNALAKLGNLHRAPFPTLSLERPRRPHSAARISLADSEPSHLVRVAHSV